MIKAVIFDLDNTLIDFMKIKKTCVNAAISAMISAGLPLKREKARKIMSELYDEFGIEHQQIFQKFLTKINNKVDYRILSAGIVAYRKVQTGLLEPYSKVIPTLIKLKQRGYKIAIVSDAPRLNAWIRLVEMNIADFFDVVVCFEDTKKTKPSAEPFKKAIRMLKVKPEECLMVGDWPERDIAGAKKVGMKTAFARYGTVKKIRKSGADFDLKNVSDVLLVVKKA
ncbi:MAG: TIGR02253 family HAD-type hydrolase [bacterium]|nr:TIGR02253 family HAD-type hydrolase [bacterium]